MAGYRRTVKAALAETKSIFALGEALATEIPPQRRGPTERYEQQVVARLTEAREAIIEAGGEPKAVGTLGHYRLTALWVSNDVGRNFRWAKASFSAHNEARAVGMDVEEFRKNPRTVRETRQASGKASKDGDPERIVNGWSSEQKQEADEHLERSREPSRPARDPAAAKAMQEDAEEAAKVSKRQAKRDERELEGRGRWNKVQDFQDAEDALRHAANDVRRALGFLEHLSPEEMGPVSKAAIDRELGRLRAGVDLAESWRKHGGIAGQVEAFLAEQ